MSESELKRGRVTIPTDVDVVPETPTPSVTVTAPITPKSSNP